MLLQTADALHGAAVRRHTAYVCPARITPSADRFLHPCSSHAAGRRQYETFSYLPPLTNQEIARQVDYIINNGYTPCLEFADPATSFVDNSNTVRFSGVSAVRSVQGISGMLSMLEGSCAMGLHGTCMRACDPCT